ncbi:MAG TPA: SET domain-containing protein-lysine N-methyltransferase [Nitrososphaerales archaeon]|nr:SET domain-containing protein-lysine N-methyltransferase [Nitrososphaerales archaeon]
MPRRVTQEKGDEEGTLRISEAGAKGKGIFAARRIELGELVWDYGGEERWIKEIPKRVWRYCFQVDYDKYVVPKEGSPGWFMNHSCEPDCVIMGRTKIVALRRIEAGEEVTFDYSTNVGWKGFSMRCRCGMKGCRKVIRCYAALPDEIKGHYGACVSAFLLRPVSPPEGSG